MTEKRRELKDEQKLAAEWAAALAQVRKNDEFCIKNEEFCIKNKEFCIQNDEMCRALRRRRC